MWIFLNDAMVSIVAHRAKPGHLLVRARLAGDLRRAFPALKLRVEKTPNADYLYRVTLPRAQVASAMATAVAAIDYGNFKGSVPRDMPRRSSAYSRVWSAMLDAQLAECPRSALSLGYGGQFLDSVVADECRGGR